MTLCILIHDSQETRRQDDQGQREEYFKVVNPEVEIRLSTIHKSQLIVYHLFLNTLTLILK